MALPCMRGAARCTRPPGRQGTGCSKLTGAVCRAAMRFVGAEGRANSSLSVRMVGDCQSQRSAMTSPAAVMMPECTRLGTFCDHSNLQHACRSCPCRSPLVGRQAALAVQHM